MKNALSRFGYTCAATALFCATAGIMSAESMNPITVNLPEAIMAGGSTLPAGTYTISDIEAGSGVHVFVFRGGSGKPVMLQAETMEQVSEPSRSRLVLSRKGSEVRLDKLLIEGSSLGYEFDPGPRNDLRDRK